MPVKVKVCGICSVDDARAAVAAGADYLGVNFHPASPRHVDPALAADIAAAVAGVPVVGIFVDADRARVERIAATVGLAALQFHGDESPEYCAGWPWRTIKALRLRHGEDGVARAAPYRTDYLLLDTHVPGVAGGTGVRLVLDALDAALAPRAFVAGGLTPDTVADVVRRLQPFGVDVASGVEERPGRKDHAKLQAFVRRAKAA